MLDMFIKEDDVLMRENYCIFINIFLVGRIVY